MLLVKTFLAPSKIHGIGLFADQEIKKGSVVWEFTPGFDQLIDPKELNRLSSPALKIFINYAYISKESNNYIHCFDDARFFNHSNKPNLSVAFTNEKSPIKEINLAVRNIKKGEELTLNYNEFDKEVDPTLK